MTATPPIETAQFTPIDPATGQPSADTNQRVTVQFNPVSLQLTISNTLDNKGQTDDTKQYVTQTSAKMTLDLIFDTTDDGSNVRSQTTKVAAFMTPEPPENTPQVVLFEWGLFAFQGLVESYKETLDFFAPTGVPLRAAINLTLASQEKRFEDRSGGEGAEDANDPVNFTPGGESFADVATQAGSPSAAHAIAAANGQENLRFISGPIAVSPTVDLRSPAAFASGSTGGSALSLDLGSPNNSPFAGLRTVLPSPPSSPLKPDRLLPPNPVASLTPSVGVGIQPGGQASPQGSTSLKADVGTRISLKDRLQFES